MSDKPPAQGWPLISWLRLNTGLMIGLITLVTIALTALWRTSDLVHQIAADHAEIESLHRDMISVDARFNAIQVDRGTVSEVFRNTDARLEQRIAVLEAQIAFLSTRLPTPKMIGKQ